MMIFSLIHSSGNGQYSDLHGGHSGVIFHEFPIHAEDYTGDVRAIMDETIARYGAEEWKLAVLTGELHGHLGVYSLIGAKMGLYARELLEAGHDEISIVSRAGLNPPVSCMNDGLQVSTGATMGHGLFRADSSKHPLPCAVFTYKGQQVELCLEEEINITIQNEIKAAVGLSGGLTPEYWRRVRVLGLQLWQELDRKKCFVRL